MLRCDTSPQILWFTARRGVHFLDAASDIDDLRAAAGAESPRGARVEEGGGDQSVASDAEDVLWVYFLATLMAPQSLWGAVRASWSVQVIVSSPLHPLPDHSLQYLMHMQPPPSCPHGPCSPGTDRRFQVVAKLSHGGQRRSNAEEWLSQGRPCERRHPCSAVCAAEGAWGADPHPQVLHRSSRSRTPQNSGGCHCLAAGLSRSPALHSRRHHINSRASPPQTLASLPLLTTLAIT